MVWFLYLQFLERVNGSLSIRLKKSLFFFISTQCYTYIRSKTNVDLYLTNTNGGVLKKRVYKLDQSLLLFLSLDTCALFLYTSISMNNTIEEKVGNTQLMDSKPADPSISSADTYTEKQYGNLDTYGETDGNQIDIEGNLKI